MILKTQNSPSPPVGKEASAESGEKKAGHERGRGLTDLDMRVGHQQRIKSCTSPCFLTSLQGKGLRAKKPFADKPFGYFWASKVSSPRGE